MANLGALYRKTSRPGDGRQALEEAVRLGDRLVQAHPKEAGYKEVLRHALAEQAALYFERAKPDLAEAAAQRALQVAEELVHDHPTNGEYRAAVATASTSLGALWYEFRNRPAEARTAYEKALGILERLIEEDPEVWPYAAFLYEASSNLALLLQETGQGLAALDVSTRAINRRESALRSKQSTVDGAKGLASQYADRAFILSQQKRYTGALRDYDQAIRLSPEEPELRHLRALTKGHALVDESEHAIAAESAKMVAADASLTGRTLFLAAGLLCRCAGAVSENPVLAEQYAASAVELLRRAQTAGYFQRPLRVEQLKHDAQLAPLRARSDFREFVSAVERAISSSQVPSSARR
jgi:tetratricopeptide (TPR) repeat protein